MFGTFSVEMVNAHCFSMYFSIPILIQLRLCLFSVMKQYYCSIMEFYKIIFFIIIVQFTKDELYLQIISPLEAYSTGHFKPQQRY